MNYDQPQLTDALAAEYVLGTLKGPARRRFERLLETNSGLRADVYFWQMRLGEMAPFAVPVAPPASAWAGVRSRMQASTGGDLELQAAVPAENARGNVVPMKSRTVKGSGEVAGWRILAGLATAAAIVLAMLVAPRGPVSGIHLPMLAAGSRPQLIEAADAPLYVAQLRVPESNIKWLVSLSPDQSQINVVAAGDYPDLGDRRIQLWWISKATGPIPVGELPSRGGLSTDIALPKVLSGDDESEFTLAVSLEPEDSRPTDLPNGPVLTSVQNLSTSRQRIRGI